MPRIVGPRIRHSEWRNRTDLRTPCLIQESNDMYWRSLGDGTTADIEQAYVFDIERVIAFGTDRDIRIIQPNTPTMTHQPKSARASTERITKEALAIRTDLGTPCLILNLAAPTANGYWGPSSKDQHIDNASVYTIAQAKALVTDTDVAVLFTETGYNYARVVTRRMKAGELGELEPGTEVLIYSSAEEPTPYWGPMYAGFYNLGSAHAYSARELIEHELDRRQDVHLFKEEKIPSNQPAILTSDHLKVERNWSRGFIFHIKKVADGTWKRGPGLGWSTDYREAEHHPLSDVKQYLDNGGFQVYFTPRKTSDAPMKKCAVSQVLTSTIIELCKAAPLNPITRGHLMSRCGQDVPAECDTWEKISEWIEWNITPIPGAGLVVRDASRTPVPATPTPQAEAFSVDVTASNTESGKVNFTRHASGSSSMPIYESDIHEMAADCDSLGDLVDSVRCNIGDRTDEITLDEYSSEELDEYDIRDTDNFDWDTSNSALRDQLVSWLSRSDPETLARLQENE